MDLAEYDLTMTMSKYLDQHQTLPLLNFMEENNGNPYRKRDLLIAKLELVSNTKMIDFAGEIYTQIYGPNEEKMKEYEQKRSAVHKDLEDLKQQSLPILCLISEEGKIDELRKKGDFTLPILKSNYGVSESTLSHFYNYAKLTFECGMYEEAANLLHYYRELSSDDKSEESEKFQLEALWGTLAAEILLADSTRALDALEKLKIVIEQRNWENQIDGLTQRAWMIHWSLFVFVNLGNSGLSIMVPFLTSDNMLNTIQTDCPHMLRYLAVGTVLQEKKYNSVIEKVVNSIKTVRPIYSDPLTEFLAAIYIDYDFDRAQDLLIQIKRVWTIDFFLCYWGNRTYLESARVLLFESFCKVHKRMGINEIKNMLDLPQKERESEKKLLQLLQETKCNGKIDTNQNEIIMTHTHTTIFQTIMEKTKEMSNRTNQLMESVEKQYKQRINED